MGYPALWLLVGFGEARLDIHHGGRGRIRFKLSRSVLWPRDHIFAHSPGTA